MSEEKIFKGCRAKKIMWANAGEPKNLDMKNYSARKEYSS